MITVDGVWHWYTERKTDPPVLADVSVTLGDPRVGVLGANGSGKSTFARLINGLILPTMGTVTVSGLSTVRQGRELRKRVGFCFTDPDVQIVMPTVHEDVAFSLRASDLSKDEVASRADAILERFGIAGLADSPSHLLSGGQKQLLALASVLVKEPEIVVMDEPTTLLDLRNSRMIAEVVSNLPNQVIVVTHDLALVESFDRVLVFDAGRLVCDDAADVALRHYLGLL